MPLLVGGGNGLLDLAPAEQEGGQREEQDGDGAGGDENRGVGRSHRPGVDGNRGDRDDEGQSGGGVEGDLAALPRAARGVFPGAAAAR